MLGDKHGEVHFKLENNIITATFIGSFNLEGALVYTEGIKPLIHSLGNKPFGILVDNRLMEGGTPEAYQALEAYNKWLMGRSIVAKAFVTPSNIAMTIATNYSPSLKKQNIHNFPSLEEAMAWLKLQLK